MTFDKTKLNQGNKPKYRIIADEIRAMVQRGELKPGDLVSSERQLARQLGVSIITVNRAMAELTRHNIIERRTGSGSYVREPDRNVRRRVGFLTHGASPPGAYGMGIMFTTLFHFWNHAGYDLVPLCRTPPDYDEAVRQYGLCALLIYSPRREFIPAIERLHRKGFPVAALSSIQPELAEISYGYSNEAVMKAAVDYLALCGCREIALVLPDEPESVYNSREEGFRRAMWTVRLPLNPDWILRGPDPEGALRQLLGAPNRPQALILGVCRYVPLVYRILDELKLRVPEDISILSIDENDAMLSLERPPSSYRVNFMELCLEGSRSLLAALENRQPDPVRNMNFEFIDRQSVNPLKERTTV